MKKREILKYKLPNGQVFQRPVEYIASTLVSGIALATGQTAGSFFANPVTDSVSNYVNNNVTPFRNGIGRGLSLVAALAGPAAAEVPWGPAATRTAYEKLRTFGQLEINYGGDPNDSISMRDLLIETPIVIQNVAAAENVATSINPFANLQKLAASSRAYSLGDPAPLLEKVAMKFTLSFNNGSSVAAALNTFILVLAMRAEEWFDNSPSPTRV